MKALTLTQPYATLVAIGEKRLETRSWRTSYRGPLAIHAAKGWMSLRFGGDLASFQLARYEERFGLYDEGRYAWALGDVRRTAHIPCRGYQGLWTPSDDLERRILHSPSYHYRDTAYDYRSGARRQS